MGHFDSKTSFNVLTVHNNACEKNYGQRVFTPAELFNGRKPEIPGDNFAKDIEGETIDKAQKIRHFMSEIAKSRNLGMDNLYLSAKNKPRQYEPGERVLVWRQFVLKKRLLKNGILAAKLSRFWGVGKIKQRLGEKYKILLEGGEIQTYHRRQMKPFEIDWDEDGEA